MIVRNKFAQSVGVTGWIVAALAITAPLAVLSAVITQAGQNSTVAPVQVAQAETYVCLLNKPGYPAKYHRVCLPR